MGHKVTVYKIAATPVEVEIPEACPHCSRPFTIGETSVVAYRYAPVEETVRLITTKKDGVVLDALDFKRVSASTDRPTLTTRYYCGYCRRAVTPNVLELADG